MKKKRKVLKTVPVKKIKFEDLKKLHPNIWGKKFDELENNEKADFLSAANISYLSEDKDWGNYDEVVEIFKEQVLKFT